MNKQNLAFQEIWFWNERSRGTWSWGRFLQQDLRDGRKPHLDLSWRCPAWMPLSLKLRIFLSFLLSQAIWRANPTMSKQDCLTLFIPFHPPPRGWGKTQRNHAERSHRHGQRFFNNASLHSPWPSVTSCCPACAQDRPVLFTSNLSALLLF